MAQHFAQTVGQCHCLRSLFLRFNLHPFLHRDMNPAEICVRPKRNPSSRLLPPSPAVQTFQQPVYAPQQAVYVPQQIQVVIANPYKSKITAGLLALFLGALGIHRFYLGHNGLGLIQLVLCLGGWLTCGITTIIAGIWAFIDMILIFTGGISKDAQGQPLV